jgi:thiol-disulfide isomerase/thioredoxin
MKNNAFLRLAHRSWAVVGRALLARRGGQRSARPTVRPIPNTDRLLQRLMFCGVVAAVALLSPDSRSSAAGAAKLEATNNLSANPASHTLSATNAVAAWDELTLAAKEPSPPDEWQLKEPTDEEKFRFLMPFAMTLADKSKDFYSRFPGDTNAFVARSREFGILSWAVEHGATNQQPRLDAAEKAMLTEPTLTDDDRFDIRQASIQRAVHRAEADGDAAMLGEFEKGARLLQKDFPKRPEVVAMLLQVAENSDPEKARTLLKELSTNDVPGELKDAETEMQKELDRVGNPFTLQFTAMDGREVDLAKMPGKVVLVDFWATWSEESIQMLPDIQQTYTNLHAKGFEIVGVNLDEDKESLTNAMADLKLVWPEYFDGKKLESKFAIQYGIKDLPVAWLVDKKGVLRYINGGFDMKKKIESLLAE